MSRLLCACSHRHKERGFETCSFFLRDSRVAMYQQPPVVITNCNMCSLQGRGVENLTND